MTIANNSVGLGLRRELLPALNDTDHSAIDFFELAPENWIGIGGKWGKSLQAISEKTPIICHGLSLSLGGSDPFDGDFITALKQFLADYQVPLYSEHLSYCSNNGHLYELLPLPFTEEAVYHVSQRIREIQDRLERRIAIENNSYYLTPEKTLTEAEFINAVLAESDCDLLLDINNVYVNSQNHNYDPYRFLETLSTQHTRYYHVAGHFQEPDGFIIDSHGANVIDPVWQLLQQAYTRIGVKPTLLERDFNIPAMDQLLDEIDHIKQLQTQTVQPLIQQGCM